MSNAVHETLIIDRLVNASTKQVLSAWSDTTARTQWGPPSDTETMKY